jgi:hypothetical protein
MGSSGHVGKHPPFSGHRHSLIPSSKGGGFTGPGQLLHSESWGKYSSTIRKVDASVLSYKSVGISCPNSEMPQDPPNMASEPFFVFL